MKREEEYLLMFALRHRLVRKRWAQRESFVFPSSIFFSFLHFMNHQLEYGQRSPHVEMLRTHGRSCSCMYREKSKRNWALDVVLWWGFLLSFFFLCPPLTSFPFLVDSLSPEKVADGVLSSRWLPKGTSASRSSSSKKEKLVLNSFFITIFFSVFQFAFKLPTHFGH